MFSFQTKKYRSERQPKKDEIFRIVILICYVLILCLSVTILIYVLVTRHNWSSFREILDDSVMLKIECIIVASSCIVFVMAIALSVIARCRGRGAALGILVLSCLTLAGKKHFKNWNVLLLINFTQVGQIQINKAFTMKVSAKSKGGRLATVYPEAMERLPLI